MRFFTIVNGVLWFVLLVLWIPYVLSVGLADPISQQVMLILGVTAALMFVLAVYRLSRRRPILG